MNSVRDNPTEQRYELLTEAGLAFIDYYRSDGVVTMTHAEVPAAVNGRGLGAVLAQGALELVRSQGEKVMPRCPFIVTFIKRHPEYQDLLARSI